MRAQLGTSFSKKSIFSQMNPHKVTGLEQDMPTTLVTTIFDTVVVLGDLVMNLLVETIDIYGQIASLFAKFGCRVKYHKI